MNRASCLTVCFALGTMLAAHVASADDLIINLGNASFEDGVKSRARQILAASGNGLGHHSMTDENQDQQSLIAYFTPSSDNTLLASFSDDQVTVYIEDTTTGSGPSDGLGGQVGQGVALDDLDHSLVELNYAFTAGHVYRIRVEYKNIKYTGNGDIDGVVLFAYNGGGAVVPQVEIFVRAKRSGTPDAWSSSTAVCAGGIASNAHTAQIEVRTTPPTRGYTITARLDGGNGASRAARLMVGTTTDTDGKIHGELVSSDAVEDATVIVGTASALVSFDWDIEWSDDLWVIDPELTRDTAHTSHTVSLFHHGEPIDQHQIEFRVYSATRSSGTPAGDPVSDADLPMLAHFSGSLVTSDGSGRAADTLMLDTNADPPLSSLELQFDDRTVTSSGIAAFRKRILKAMAGGRTSNYKSVDTTPTGLVEGRLQIEYVPPRWDPAFNIYRPAEGTSPESFAYVWPEQLVLFQLDCEDLDYEQTVTDGPWRVRHALSSWGEYKVTIALTNAEFENPDPGSRTTKNFRVTTANLGGFEIHNIGIRVSPDLGRDDTVGLTIDVEDLVVIPLTARGMGVPPTAIQDEALHNTDWRWSNGQGRRYPTRQTVKKEYALPSPEERPIGSLEGFAFCHIYDYGPLVVGERFPWYEGLTVVEEFDLPDESNLLLKWLTRIRANRYGNVENAIGDLFDETGSNTTFTISNEDTTSDTHTGDANFGSQFENKLSFVGRQQAISYALWQHHKIPFDSPIGKYRLTKIRKPPQPGVLWDVRVNLNQSKGNNQLQR